MEEVMTAPAPQEPMIPPAAGGISPAFLRVPVNPNTRPAVEPAEEPAQANAVQMENVPPAQPLPAPTPPIQQPPTVQQPAPQPVPQYQQPAYDQQYLIQQMAQEREQLRRELAARDAAIENLARDSVELENLRRQQEAADAVANMDFSQFQTVDENEAKRISQATLAATQPKFDQMQQELAQQRKFLNDTVAQQRQQMQQMQQMDSIRRVLAAHPDYYDLQNTPEYQNFMRQRDGLSSQTYDQRAAMELYNGNVDYVIDLLNKVKGQRPNPQQVMSVPPVQTAAAPAVPAAPAEQLPTLHELNNLIQTRQITHDEYRTMLNKLRSAQNQQR